MLGALSGNMETGDEIKSCPRSLLQTTGEQLQSVKALFSLV